MRLVIPQTLTISMSFSLTIRLTLMSKQPLTSFGPFWTALEIWKLFTIKKKVMVGHRRNTNLSDILVNARIRFPSTKRLNQVSRKITNVSVYTSNIVCIYCPKVDTSGTIMSTNSGRMYKTPDGGSCGSNNVVYLVTCKVCHKHYLGETFRTLKQRFYVNFYD